MNRLLNDRAETGSDTRSYLHTRNQSVYRAADASCLSIAPVVAALEIGKLPLSFDSQTKAGVGGLRANQSAHDMHRC